LLLLCNLEVGKRNGKKIGGSNSSYRERCGRRLRGAGEEISDNVVGAREMKESGRKLGKEGKMPLLPGGKGCAGLEIAATKGLWSVKRVKGRPSRKKRKWRTERKAARSSRSKVE
jgi:hypothetical protein